MKRKYISVIIILTLLACVDKKKEAIKRQDQFKTISFATGGCYGKCPFLAIQIDSSLTYKFYGGRYTEKQGFYTAKVTQGFWDSLNIKMEQAKFKQLDTLYNASVDDMSIESYFTYGQIRKPLYGQEMDLPDNIRSVFYWLMDSYKKLQLTKVDTLLFETKIQFGQGPIPPPKIIKFTPPEIVE